MLRTAIAITAALAASTLAIEAARADTVIAVEDVYEPEARTNQLGLEIGVGTSGLVVPGIFPVVGTAAVVDAAVKPASSPLWLRLAVGRGTFHTIGDDVDFTFLGVGAEARTCTSTDRLCLKFGLDAGAMISDPTTYEDGRRADAHGFLIVTPRLGVDVGLMRHLSLGVALTPTLLMAGGVQLMPGAEAMLRWRL